MITRNIKLATRTTFYGLRAIFLASIALGVTLGLTGALDTGKAQQNRVRTYSQTDVERLIRDVEQSRAVKIFSATLIVGSIAVRSTASNERTDITAR